MKESTAPIQAVIAKLLKFPVDPEPTEAEVEDLFEFIDLVCAEYNVDLATVLIGVVSYFHSMAITLLTPEDLLDIQRMTTLGE